MRLWLFTFTAPDRVIASARVAAHDKAEAASILGQIIGRPLVGANYQPPEEGAILAAFGKIDTEMPGVISIMDLEGVVHETRIT